MTAFEILANIFFVLSLKISEKSEKPLLFNKKTSGKMHKHEISFLVTQDIKKPCNLNGYRAFLFSFTG